MSREVISEQSSIREGAGYDEVFQTGQKPEKGHSWSLERETSARSPDEDGDYIGEEDEEEIDKGEVKGEGEVDGEEEIEDDGVMKGDGDEDDTGGRTPKVGSSVNPESGHARPFIKRRNCHYKTNPIGYWGKGSTVGWYKVLGFLYL